MTRFLDEKKKRPSRHEICSYGDHKLVDLQLMQYHLHRCENLEMLASAPCSIRLGTTSAGGRGGQICSSEKANKQGPGELTFVMISRESTKKWQ